MLYGNCQGCSPIRILGNEPNLQKNTMLETMFVYVLNIAFLNYSYGSYILTSNSISYLMVLLVDRYCIVLCVYLVKF